MRELPEAYVQAAQCETLLRGKTIEAAKTGESAHSFTWYNDAWPDIGPLCGGKPFTGARARGGLLEMQFGDATILLMDGASPRYWPDASSAPAKRQLYLSFTDGSALTAVTAMYGGVLAYGPEGLKNDYCDIAAKKPSPFSDAFTEEYFLSLREGLSGKTSMKAFLATEQRIPGLGNGVLQDILFAAGIHPKRRMDALSDEGFRTLYRTLRSKLTAMRDGGGRDVEKDLYGNAGGYESVLSRKTLGKPCPVCGTPIEKAAYLGGAVYFCPNCQKP